MASVFLLCGFALAAAQTPGNAGLTGSSVFQKNCAKCHGKTAEGRHFGGPSLVSGKVAAMSAGDVRAIIADGKGHMPKFADKLTSSQIDELVQQIEALNKK